MFHRDVTQILVALALWMFATCLFVTIPLQTSQTFQKFSSFSMSDMRETCMFCHFSTPRHGYEQIKVYVVTMGDGTASDLEDIKSRRRKWEGTWSHAWPQINYTWIFANKSKAVGQGCAFGQRAAMAQALRDRAETAIFMEDDAVPFTRENSSWLSDFEQLMAKWPGENGFLLLGGWNIEVNVSNLPTENRTIEAGIKRGLTPISRAWGGYGWAIRRHHLPLLINFLDSTLFRMPRRKYSIDSSWWPFWQIHGAFVATPLLIDHSPGFSHTHHRNLQRAQSEWQGKRDWWNVRLNRRRLKSVRA